MFCMKQLNNKVLFNYSVRGDRFCACGTRRNITFGSREQRYTDSSVTADWCTLTTNTVSLLYNEVGTLYVENRKISIIPLQQKWFKFVKC